MNILMALMAARSFIGSVPTHWVMIWFAVCSCISIYFIYGKRRFDPKRINHLSDGWRRFMTKLAVGITVIWLPVPLGAMLFLSGSSYLGAMFMTVVMLSGTVVGLGSVPIAAVLTAAIITIPVIVTSAVLFGPFNDIVVSFLMLLFVLSVFAIKHSKMMWEMEERGRLVSGSMSELAQANENIRKLADTDQMTGLMNRRVFIQHLEELVTHETSASGQSYACLTVDLDHFKQINDSLGHAAGDRFLREVAQSLTRKFGAQCRVARLGGDEFALVSREPVTMVEAEELCQAVVTVLGQDIYFGGRRLRGGGTVGCAPCPQQARSVTDWLNHADHALRIAKQDLRGSYRIFTDADQSELTLRTTRAAALGAAIDAAFVRTVYQPQVDIETGALHGVETLARWTPPDGSGMSPPEFFELAEMSGRVLDLADRIFDRAIWDIQTLAAKGLRLPSFSINLHPSQLHHPDRLFPLLDRLAEAQGGANRTVLEITENSIIGRGAENVPKTLQQLSDAGFRISLDDFGTGFASLTHVQELPISELKIDRSFLRNLINSPEDQELIRALLMIAAPRKLDVVIEGVETEAQRDILRRLGAKIAQGYLFAGPLSAAEFGAQSPQLRVGGALSAAKAETISSTEGSVAP